MRAGPNHFRTAWIAAFTVAILSSQTTDFASTRAAAQTLLRRSKVAEAIPLLERARAADPAHYENSWDLALAYRQTNRLARARTLIQSMLAGGNNNKGELHNLLAEVEEASGNTLAAAAAYQEAAHLDPREKHIADWANHLMRYRAYDSAVKVFSSGAAMHPKSVVLRVGQVIEVLFPNLITAQEMEWLREQN